MKNRDRLGKRIFPVWSDSPDLSGRQRALSPMGRSPDKIGTSSDDRKKEIANFDRRRK